jgi:Fic family protein
VSDTPGHRWRPIEDLPDEAVGWGDPEIAAMAEEWAEGSARLADAPEVKQFRAELIREIAIETGIIEGLYRIDRGVTETLIRVGLIKEELEQGVLDRPADEILPMLKDHEAATEGLFDFVKQNRDLSTSYIKELHAHLTRHQTDTEAIVPETGQRTRIPLLRGEWKRLPNNPRRPDGTVHEYCPPEHVAAEMDRLIELHRAQMAAGLPPDVAAAWLHHRFTQIHPFQDGNGRVARSLASLVFLRARWTLLNITRNEIGYIEALEKADAGDLREFVQILGRRQRGWFDRAVTVLSAAEAQMGAAAYQLVSKRTKSRAGLSNEKSNIIDAYVKPLVQQEFRHAANLLSDANVVLKLDVVDGLQARLHPDILFLVGISPGRIKYLGICSILDHTKGLWGFAPFFARSVPTAEDFRYDHTDSSNLKRLRDYCITAEYGESALAFSKRVPDWLNRIVPLIFLEWERRR